MSPRLQAISQDTRIAQLYTPLGKDRLVLKRFEGVEGLSDPFEYRIEALSEEPDINFDQAVGLQCGVKAKMYGTEREFNGILVGAQWVGIHNDLYLYRLVLRPWLWLLSHKADCRIFQEKTSPEIIKEVFNDAGFADFQFKLTDQASYPKREYCVQYRETDLNFVSRIMESEGIYYFFKHEGGKHILVLADSAPSHQPCKDLAKIPFLPEGGKYVRREQRIYEWMSERRFCTGKVEFNDYNYAKPNASLVAEAGASERYANSDLLVYDYPGNYPEKSIGERYAQIRLQAEQALDHRRHANGDAVSLYPGGCTTLERHPSGGQNIEYLVVRCSHSLIDEQYRSGEAGPAEEIYHGRYEFQPKDRPFRAPIVTPKPLIHGVQTAKVVTKDSGSSEEIDVDKLTEIYVRFYWDHRKMRSCKLRCAQVWSGKGWGGQFIPRVGMEAVVEFLEGDPDRPLVVGCVYNAEQPVPFDLPANKTQSGLRTRSSLGGSAANCNEFIFEDLKGSELVKLHAEKNLTTEVENDASHWVGHDEKTVIDHNRTETVHGNESITIDGNRTETVHSNETITIDKNRTETVVHNESVTIAMNRAHTIGITDTLTVGAARTHSVGGAETITVGAARTISVGGIQSISVGANESTDIGKDRSTKVGKDETLSVGKKIAVEAGDEIVLKTGDARIIMKKNGDITIQGKAITIKGSGNVVVKGQKILQN